MSNGTRNRLPAPGWYPDPAAAGSSRFWDGGAWTSFTAAEPVGQVAPGRVRLGPQRVGFAGAVPLALRRIADYRGRSSRREYWWFQLAAILVWFLLGVPVELTSPAADDPYATTSGLTDVLGAVLVVLYVLYLVTDLPLTIRRLHDVGRRGWWLLLGLVPVVGNLVLLAFLCTGSENDVNAFGPGPARRAVP